MGLNAQNIELVAHVINTRLFTEGIPVRVVVVDDKIQFVCSDEQRPVVLDTARQVWGQWFPDEEMRWEEDADA